MGQLFESLYISKDAAGVFMHKMFLTVMLPVIVFIMAGCSALVQNEKHDFVRVNGSHFEIGARPYYYTGTNLWYGCYLGSPGKTGDRARLVRELDNLQAVGITNLRILGASEASYIANSLKPAIQIKPNVYDEDLLAGLDFLLDEMGKRNMRAVIFLNNYWEWTGGMAQYNEWANGGGGLDPANNNYPNFMDYSASFYGNQKAQALFTNFVHMLLTRKNQINGIAYSNDPTIMAWQLANEPRPGRNDTWLTQYYQWIDGTAAYIHSIDKNHLVSAGSEGLAGTLQDSAIYYKTNNSPNIDYLNFHLWPKNWSWFDAFHSEQTYPKTEANAINYINQHVAFAGELNKPIVMEEFGIPRDSELCKTGTPTTMRDRYFAKILGVVYENAAAGSPMAGTNVWAWGGEGRGQHPDDKWLPGDPFVGDPPQEPQGLNSIFDSDLSTLSIFKAHAAKMKALTQTKTLVQKP